MTFRNSDDRWGIVSQVFHWSIVGLIVAMAYLGLSMVDLPNTPYKIRLYTLHKSIGLSILALVVLRLLWRMHAGSPRTLVGIPTWQSRIATLTHGALYTLLFAVPVSGWIMNSATGFPLRWFNLVNLPPIAAKSDALRMLAMSWHQILFWCLIALTLAHAGAAFHHHLFRRDATLARMLPRRWLGVRSSEQETPDA